MARNSVAPRVLSPWSSWHNMDIEQFGPFGPLEKKNILTIPWQDIHPAIRLLRGDRDTNCYIPERILFDHLLVYFRDGTGRYTIGKEVVEVQKRHFFLIPPFTRVSLIMEGSHFFTSIHFDWKPNFPAADQLSGRKPYEIRFPLNVQIPRHQVLAQGDPLAMQLQEALELWQGETDLSRLHANIVLAEVLVTLLKRAEVKRSSASGQHIHMDQKRVELALALMQEKLSEDLSLGDVAWVAGLRASHFSYIFRKWTGRSPMEHLLAIRIQRAKELLHDIHLTIKEAAFRSGFRDYSYFSKIFTRFTGVSPSQYREMILAQRIP